MNYKKKRIQYLIFDYLMAALAWLLFFSFRRLYIEPLIYGENLTLSLEKKLILGIILIPCFWIFLYYFSGYYKEVYRKSQFQETGLTFIHSLTGVIIIFFLLLLDDVVASYKNYYHLFLAYLALHYILTLIPRFILTSISIMRIKKGQLFFNTIIIGNVEEALKVYNLLQDQERLTGNKFAGFVDIKGKYGNGKHKELKSLGELKDIREILNNNDIKEVIIALDNSEKEKMNNILNLLAINNVTIKAIPSMNDILIGKLKITHLFATPLIQISHDLMPAWQENIKQLSDIIISVLSLILLSPLILFLIISIKITSPGPAIHIQERIGKFGKPFMIYKFRSMFIDAEKNGPDLSSKNDPRLTKTGRFMRKFRLDEIPNFINVLKGEMSLVGPRPERQFYIDQIIKKAPHYIHLQKVKPGITSWGQVKFGYAENIDQMIRRLEYDLLYVENMSLLMDIKIIAYTISIIFKGRGI